MGRTAAALALTLLALAAGCAPGTSSSPPAPASGTSAFDKVLDSLPADGSVDRQGALEAFSLVFGRLPGVPMPSGPREVVLSGTGPLRWVLGHFDELTAGQRQAVLKAVGAVPGAAARDLQMRLVADTATNQAQIQMEGLVAQARAYFSSKLPPLLLPEPKYTVYASPTQVTGDWAETYWTDAAGDQAGPVKSCRIVFQPRTWRNTEPVMKEVAFHEVFHCLEARMVPNLAVLDRDQPRWLIEGGASWAMAEGVGAPTLAGSLEKIWPKYLKHPEIPLFSRTYDAIGYFAHVQEAGGDVYRSFPAALLAYGRSGNAAAFSAFVPDAGRFFPTWPTGLLRKPGLGPDWDATGPGIPAVAAVPRAIELRNGSHQLRASVPAFSNLDLELNVSTDVMLLVAGEYSRLRSAAGSLDFRQPSDFYCARTGGCACPSGSFLAGLKYQQIDPGVYYLAMSGGTAGNHWEVWGYSLDDFCKETPFDKCLVGHWTLTSHPSLPGPAQITRLNETLVVPDGGPMTLNIDVADSVGAGSLGTVTATVTGPIVIQAFTLGGAIQAKSLDISALDATASLNGVLMKSFPVTQITNGIVTDLTPVAYTCSPTSLTLTSSTGVESTWARS